MKLRVWGLIGIVSLYLFACKSTSQLKRMTECTYTFHSVKKIKLAEINIDGKSRLRELEFNDLVAITQQYLTGELPVKFVANVSVFNPNSKMAAVERLQWKMIFNEKEISEGLINEKVEIEGGEMKIIPLEISIDLMKILDGETKKEILNFAFNIADKKGYPSNLELKVKPSISFGKAILASPTYFTLQHRVE